MHTALGQELENNRIVQLSGIIVGEDSINGVPGVHIYVPKAGRGTTSNIYGYFSMPVLEGDSVVVSAVSYRKQNFKVPHNHQTESFTIVIELESDTTYLPTIHIFPWPTEELFKEAILALELPDQRNYNAMSQSLSPETLAQMYWDLPMDGSMNHRYFVDQRFTANANRFMYPTLSLLNPAAWAQLIKSIKKGDFKSDK
ncbi:MAG: carboxypeptidase-like regulatory domain-containing protein [Bacteroidetes bacterium]|nr:carboxypeptidase-like regulatory domain-containing protein [Bacteroidota bacterium]